MIEVKQSEEQCNLQPRGCTPVLKIQLHGCYDTLEINNPMKTVIA